MTSNPISDPGDKGPRPECKHRRAALEFIVRPRHIGLLYYCCCLDCGHRGQIGDSSWLAKAGWVVAFGMPANAVVPGQLEDKK